jgi:hypothetical protein
MWTYSMLREKNGVASSQVTENTRMMILLWKADLHPNLVAHDLHSSLASDRSSINRDAAAIKRSNTIPTTKIVIMNLR